MRKLLYLLLVVTALWSAYWFAGSTALRQGAEQWFADLATKRALDQRAKRDSFRPSEPSGLFQDRICDLNRRSHDA